MQPLEAAVFATIYPSLNPYPERAFPYPLPVVHVLSVVLNMNNPQKLLAIITGCTMAFGYSAITHRSEWIDHNVIIGVMLGLVTALGMIRQSRQYTFKSIIYIILPMFAAVIACLVYLNADNMLLHFTWILVAIGSIIAFVYYGNNNDRSEST
jgi:small basic protein